MVKRKYTNFNFLYFNLYGPYRIWRLILVKEDMQERWILKFDKTRNDDEFEYRMAA